ncbi:TetR/AcrR family transcriptional regulator [Dactylosporangium sp. NBC_01737]|uniref:TetR/AcrR family transcriptional regulator n=1 Tax=Dactylosporangium sp. NBC_01737 TaxID=2975959 RepID=UPI002E0E3533|nr:TetR/AcrR family transcriptional regulator [Dactylosporangium sp. NBC_01737]
MSTSARSAPRREKARAATIEEIKLTALTHMRETGTVDFRFADIARAMEMTPPALYRYFADRDELLSALIAGAYDDLGRCVAEARDAVPDDDIGGRFLAVARSYRQWARQEPQQFALILGLPVAGYSAPVDGPTTEAAQRAMSQLSQLFLEALELGVLAPPRLRDVHPAIAACAAQKNEHMPVAIPAETFQAMLHTWSTLHGFAALEAYGHFDWIEEAGRDALFDGHARLAAEVAGMPAPKDA